MTGTGINAITQNTIPSYNTTVNAINRFQKDNVNKLDRALSNVYDSNSRLNSSIGLLVNSITSLQKQVFLNQVLLDNWDHQPPYSYDYTILQ